MKKSKNWFLFISLFLLIIFRFFSTRPVFKVGDKVRITTVVYSDPIQYSTSQYVKLAGLSIYLPKVPEVSYGDKIVVEGTVKEKGKLDNPKTVKILGNGNFATKFRNRIITFYEKTLPEPEAGLLTGIVLGSKGALSSDFWKETKNVGVAHVVVASGTNVTFVVSFLMMSLITFLPRRKMMPFVILGIVLYLFISGFEAPLVRAAIMATVAFIVQGTGRLISGWRNLILTAGIMLVYRPDWLMDIGFILSFVSTGSLMLFEAKINKRLKLVPEVLKEGLSTSLAAQIGVAPILFVTFGQFNIWSPVVNALVLWTVPILMIFGAVGGIAGLLVPILGKIVLYLCYPLLIWFTSIVSLFNF